MVHNFSADVFVSIPHKSGLPTVGFLHEFDLEIGRNGGKPRVSDAGGFGGGIACQG